MDRRTYFKQLALGVGSIVMAPSMLVSCNKNNSKDTINLSGEFLLEPYASLEEMQNALRLNKGHLTEEMQRVIQTKMHKKIFKKWAKHYVKAFGGGRSLSLVGMYAVELASTYGMVALLINNFNPNGLHLSFKGGKPSLTI